MNVLDLYIQDGHKARRAGHEYQGPCPGCGGNDRFCIYPKQKNEEGTYHCGHGKGGNGCGKGGDIIQYLRDFRGMTYKDACNYLGKSTGNGIGRAQYAPIKRPRSARNAKHAHVVAKHPDRVADRAKWQEKGLKFVDHCHKALLAKKNTQLYLGLRGITMASIIKYRLGWHAGVERNGKDCLPAFRPWPSWGLRPEKKENGKYRCIMLPAGVVIPYIVDGSLHRLTIRLAEPDPRMPKKKYHYVIGSMRDVWLSNPSARAHVLAEAELDCIAADEAAGDYVGTIGPGGTGNRPDVVAHDQIRRSGCLLDAMDYDGPGAAAGKFWRLTYPSAYKRWPVPAGKDIGEAVSRGVNIRAWILAGLPAALVPQEEQKEPIPPPAPAQVATTGRHPVAELVDLMARSGAIFRIYDRGINVGVEIPQEYRWAHPTDAARLRHLLMIDDKVGQTVVDHLPDGIYGLQNVKKIWRSIQNNA